MKRVERAAEALKRLKKEYGEARKRKGQFIEWSTPLELVIGTVLSAQCTDDRINTVTSTLFKNYPTAADYAGATLRELQKEIGSVTFYKSKSRYLKRIGEILVEKHNGEVPQTMDELVELPGVAKKTASLVLAKGFGKIEGVAVDTHVRRVAPRLGLSRHDNPDKISKDLERCVERKDWLHVNEYLILHGRAVCAPRAPKCGECVLADICPSAKKFLKGRYT